MPKSLQLTAVLFCQSISSSTHAAIHTAWLKLNLLAGQQAKQTAAYGVALTYFEQAIRLLGSAAWQQHYSLTLMLHEKTAEAAYASSQYERLADLAQTLCLNTQTVVERVNTDQRVIQAHIGRNQPLDALKVGLSLLSELSIQFPQQPSPIDIAASLQAVQVSLAGRDIQSLIHLPEMNIAEKIAAMQILSAIFAPAYFAIPVMVPLITCMQVKLSLEYGNTPLSALAYTYYGLILCGQLGDIETGYQFGELALSLLAQPRFDQQPLKHIRARTLMTVAGFVKHFREPIRQNIPLLLEAYELGLETGDLEIAGHAASMYALHAYVIGHPLVTLEQELTAYSETLKQLKQAADLNFIQIYHQGILNWMGRAEICCQLAGEVYDEAQMIPQYEQTGNRSALYLAFYEKGLLCYSFGEFTAALTHMTKAATYLDAVTGSYNTALFYFYDSLIRLALFCSCSIDEQTMLIAKVEENQQHLKKWAEQAPANCLNKFSLVEAERYRVLEKSATAIDYYEQAIAQAVAQDLIYDEALAHELSGYFHLKQRQPTIAQFYLLNARYCYQRWGAFGKVVALEKQYPTLVTQGNLQRTLGFTTTLASSQQSIDVATVIKATQALGSEIALDKLLNKLMGIVLENAGAQRGVLMLLREGQWFIEAEAVASVFSRAVGTPLQATEPSHLPIGVINYVMRKGKSLVLENAHQSGQFIQDAYIRDNASKSVLCMPLLNQGQLHGLLYLENGLATGVFTWERVEVLKILSAQAVISLENAQLYKQLDAYNKTLEQKVAARTQELSETLSILQATQAELMIENALLRRQDDRAYTYQVGGSLPMDAPTYVVRQADRHLYKALSHDQYCYILNSRQMGKSSLRIQMMKRMQSEGYRCIALDFSVIGNHQTRIEQWYAGLAYSLASSLKLLPNLNLRDWWQAHDWLSPVQRLDAFIREIVLNQIGDKIIVFIDEIDSVLSLDFRADDFFVWLRTCFNYRADHPEYRRLTFVLLGVATPSQLISDRNRTPFNIGQAISLSGFQLHEAQPLLQGLRDRVTSPQALLKQILVWTQGQPFLTQKLCQLVCQSEEPIPEGTEAAWVDQLVRSHILTDWERQDDPEHLKTIRDRILSRGPLVAPMLNCYQQILQGYEVVAQDLPVHTELLLTGLVIKDNGYLKVANQIYQTIFDLAWVTHHQTRVVQSH